MPPDHIFMQSIPLLCPRPGPVTWFAPTEYSEDTGHHDYDSNSSHTLLYGRLSGQQTGSPALPGGLDEGTRSAGSAGRTQHSEESRETTSILEGLRAATGLDQQVALHLWI